MKNALRIKFTIVNQGHVNKKLSASQINFTIQPLENVILTVQLGKSECVLLNLLFGMQKPSIAKNAASIPHIGIPMPNNVKPAL